MFAAILTVLAMVSPPRAVRVAAAAELSGPARVKDGDSLVVAGHEIRLDDIDAPERNQRCRLANGRFWYPGRQAAAWLVRFIASRPVSCQTRTTDRFGRALARCQVAGQDLGHALVSAGWAFAYHRYSERETAAETQARQARRGLWRGQCDQPEDWRHHSGSRR